MEVTLGAVLLVAAVVLYILQPLITGTGSSLWREHDEMTEAEARRRVKLLALRDVEYDFATGKLDAEDYEALRLELSAEALEALDDVEREEGARDAVGDQLEEEIQRVRDGLRDGRTCGGCGFVNADGSRFCSICGSQLETPTATGA